MARSKPSALMEQIQANMRRAAQRARESEEANLLAEKAAIAAAMAESGEQPAPEPVQEPEQPEPVQQPEEAAATQEPEPLPEPEQQVNESDTERMIRSLSPVAVDLIRALIKAGGFINIARLDLRGKKGKVPYETVRTNLRRIDKEGFLASHGVGNYGVIKGMRYTLNEHLVEIFQRVHGDTPSPSEKQISLPTAAELPKKPVAKHNVLSHPEMKAWRDAGISEKQINTWISEFNVEPELLTLYMKWCAFDVEHNRKDAPVKSIANWFYSIMKHSGAYPKPAGYASLEEQRAEHLKEARASQLSEMQSGMDNDLRAYFENMLAEGEANQTYVELRDSLNSFVRGMEKIPGNPVFRSAMWAAFKAKCGL